MALIPPELMEILVCPFCHGDLEEREAESELRCVACGLRYPVRDGIPVMMVEQALPSPPRRPARNGDAD